MCKLQPLPMLRNFWDSTNLSFCYVQRTRKNTWISPISNKSEKPCGAFKNPTS